MAHQGPHKVSVSFLQPEQICLAGWSLLYQHTADLLCLNFCRPAQLHQAQELMGVSTPLVLKAWLQAQSSHPDQAFARYICEGLRSGFRIGFDYGSPLKPATANMQSALLHSGVISEYLQKEVTLGRMLGPFSSAATSPY